MTRVTGLLAIALSTSLTVSAGQRPADAVDVVPSELPGSTLPVVQEHTYKMSGRIRALLIWIGRDDVGTGLIRWRAAGDNDDRRFSRAVTALADMSVFIFFPRVA